MARPKRSSARKSKAAQRASSFAPAQISLNQRLNIIIASGDDQYEAALNAIRLKIRQLEKTTEVVFTNAMKEFPDEVLDQPFKVILGEMDCPSTNSEVETRENVTCSGIKKTTATAARKGESTTKLRAKNLGSVRQGGRQSRSAVRNNRTPATSHSLPPKGVITPKFDTRRGRTPSLTRKAKPGEVLVSLSGSPVRSENKLQDKTAAIITLGDGNIISIAPDTDAKQCKVGRDNLAKLQALQQAITSIVKNSAKS